MNRSHFVGLFFLAAVSAVPSMATAQQSRSVPLITHPDPESAEYWEEVEVWMRLNIPNRDIRDVSALNQNVAIWVDQGSKIVRGSVTQAWVHYEHFTPTQREHRSMIWLQEFRCGERQMRVIDGYSYAGTNLTGPSTKVIADGRHEWQNIRPDNILNDVYASACTGQSFGELNS